MSRHLACAALALGLLQGCAAPAADTSHGQGVRRALAAQRLGPAPVSAVTAPLAQELRAAWAAHVQPGAETASAPAAPRTAP